MWQIVRQWPDAGEYWNQVCPRVGERKLDGLRLRRRLAPQECGIEVEKGDDEFPAIVQRGLPDELSLKLHAGFTEQPRLTLQPADERRQIAIVDRALDLLPEKHLPRSGRCGVREVLRSLFDEVLDEGEAARRFHRRACRVRHRARWIAPAGVTRRPRARSAQAHMNASLTAARSFPFSSSAARTASRSPSAERNLSVRGSRPLRRNSCSSPLARDSMIPSHTDGVTTAPASISSSAHAARVKICSLSGSKLSP